MHQFEVVLSNGERILFIASDRDSAREKAEKFLDSCGSLYEDERVISVSYADA